jgi:hypothetical protein
MPWALAGAAVSAGVGVYSANKQSDAIKGGQDNANAMAERTQGVAKDTFAPYMGVGTNALSSYGNLLGLNGQDAADASMKAFQQSPGYGYQVAQGLQAVDHGAAAKGMLRSGETLRAEQTLGANLANQSFGDYMGRLNGLTNMGLQGAGAYLNAFTGQANNIQSTTTAGAGAQAGIYGSEGKAIGNAFNTAANSLGEMYQSNTGLYKPNGLLDFSSKPTTGMGLQTGAVY